MSKEVIILANGSYPTHEIPLKLLKNAEFIVCCDGAANKLVANNLEPHAIVGDLDSVSEDLKRKYEDLVFHSSTQQTNDLTKAVEFCIEKGYKNVSILGATGDREDHTLGNISLLMNYAKKLRVRMYTNSGFFTPMGRSKNIDSYRGQQVSIFAFSESSKITTANLRYALTNQGLDMLWKGTLNECMGSGFRIDFEGDPVLIFQEY